MVDAGTAVAVEAAASGAAPAAESEQDLDKGAAAGFRSKFPRWVLDWRTWITIAVIGLIVGLGGWQFARGEQLRQENLRRGVQSLAESYAAELRRQVQTSTSATWALGAVQQAFGDNFTSPKFAIVAETLIETYKGINNLQLAPDGIVRDIHPLTKADRAVIGLSLLVDPLRRPDALEAINGYPKRRATIAGPLALIQGPKGIVVRHPIFTASADEYLVLPPYTDPVSNVTYSIDCSTQSKRRENCYFPGPDDEQGRSTYFWGFSQMVATVEALLEPIDLSRLTNGTHSVAGIDRFVYQMRDANPHRSLENNSGIFAASEGISRTDRMAEAAEALIVLEEFGLSWVLAVQPEGGWPQVSSEFVVQLVLIALFTIVGGMGMGVVIIGNVRGAYLRKAAIAQIEAEKALEGRAQAAAMQARSRLIRTVMHDLRSPLMSVTNIAKALFGQDGDVPLRSMRPMVQALRTCATLMEAIVSDMLDFERIEAGRLNLVFAPFVPADLVHGALATFSTIAAGKDVRLEVPELAGTLAERAILGDARRLQQCVNNGVSNAIKFSQPGGTIALLVHFDEDAAVDPGWAVLRFTVRDHGVGLEPEELAIVDSDDMFTQVGEGKHQGNKGTGLGLSITRQILKLHHGSSLTLASDGRNKGTSFTLIIKVQLAPAAEAELLRPSAPASDAGAVHADARLSSASPVRLGLAVPSVPVQAPAASAASRSSFGDTPRSEGAADADAEVVFPPDYRVLHVEDDQFVRFTMPLQTFDLLGVSYVQAEDGHAAMQMMERGERFDCIIMDNQMPVMGGTATTLELRRLGYSGVIIGMTGDPAGCDERREFEAAGLTACLDKDSAGLEEVVRLLRDHARKLQRGLPRRTHLHEEERSASETSGADSGNMSVLARARARMTRSTRNTAAGGGRHSQWSWVSAQGSSVAGSRTSQGSAGSHTSAASAGAGPWRSFGRVAAVQSSAAAPGNSPLGPLRFSRTTSHAQQAKADVERADTPARRYEHEAASAGKGHGAA